MLHWLVTREGSDWIAFGALVVAIASLIRSELDRRAIDRPRGWIPLSRSVLVKVGEHAETTLDGGVSNGCERPALLERVWIGRDDGGVIVDLSRGMDLPRSLDAGHTVTFTVAPREVATLERAGGGVYTVRANVRYRGQDLRWESEPIRIAAAPAPS